MVFTVLLILLLYTETPPIKIKKTVKTTTFILYYKNNFQRKTKTSFTMKKEPHTLLFVLFSHSHSPDITEEIDTKSNELKFHYTHL